MKLHPTRIADDVLFLFHEYTQSNGTWVGHIERTMYFDNDETRDTFHAVVNCDTKEEARREAKQWLADYELKWA